MAKDLTLALRVKTEFENAQQDLEQLDRGLTQVGTTAQTTAAKLNSQAAQIDKGAKRLKLVGVSAAQTQQAMRMLPMQMTDVVTSLASGSPAWMVAIQQGGQIKDSFGGVGNAAKALTSLLNPMTIAVAAGAAAIGAAALAYKQGSDEADGFNRALILSGNIAGTNADQLAGWAAQIDEVAGTHHAAAEALAEVASRGTFTGDQLLQIGQSAELMRIATGRAVSETVDEFEQLAKDPGTAVQKLNDKHHFLTLAVYQQIEALQKQGDQAGAAKLAIDTYAAASDEMAKKLNENLGYIESAWVGVKKIASEAWDAMLGIGREKTLDDLKKELTDLDKLKPANALSTARLGTFQTEDVNAQRRQQLQAEIARREKKLADDQAAAKQKAIDDAAIKAQRDIQTLRDQTLTNAERREKEIAAYRRNVEKINAANPGSVTADQQAKDIAAIEAKFKDPAQQKDPRESTFATLNKQLTERIALLQAATESEEKLTDAQRFAEQIQATLADGTTKLTTAQRAAIDARLQELDAIDKLNQKKQDEKALLDVQTRLLAAQGQNAAAAAARVEKEYADLIARLEARGDSAGKALIDKLISVETAKARLGELQQQIDRAFAEQARQENSIQAQQQAGLISETNARRQIIELHRQTGAEIEKLLPQMQELAAATGDPAAIERLKDLQAELEQTKIVGNELTNSLRSGFEDGLAGALEGLAMGTMSLRDAAVAFTDSIAQSLVQLASQKIAETAFDGLASGFQAIIQAAPQAVSAITGVQTTKIAADQAMLASSVTTTQASTANQAAAAAETTAAWTPAAITASIGSFGTAAAIGLAAVIAALAFKAFAKGGHVQGDGTGTSDSIPAWLSNDEFVTRSAVVRQPGALPFLHDFNARGMSALDDWSMAVRHATGGLAGVPAPAMGSPALGGSGPMAEPAREMSTTVQNRTRIINLLDKDELAKLVASSGSFERSILNVISTNPNAIREAVG